MPPLSKSTSAAALLLAFAPLAVPDMAAATTVTTAPAPTEERADASVEPEAPGAGEGESPVDSGAPVEPEAPADTAAPVDADPATKPEPAPAPSTAPAPTPTPEAQPTTDEVTPNETPINVYVQGATDAIGQPGQRFETSIFNVKNSSGFTIPSRSLDFHWTITGPATFTRGRPPFSVANSGTANVANCTFTSPTQTDCLGANPQPLNTGGANFNHIRVPITVDASALPGDVVTVHGSFAPNAATDYVNTNEQTTSTWKVTIPLTSAVIDEPTAAVGPKPTITGQGVPGGTVDVTVGDRAPVNVRVGDDGTWSLPVTEALSDGSVTVTAVQHRNGFTAEPTTATLDVDATAPDVPIVDDPGTLDDPTGPITGTADPGSIVIVRDRDGNELGRDRANEDGDFSVRLDAPLPEGATDLVVVAADAVGNESGPATATAVVPDTTAPDAPVVERQDLATPTGPVVGTAEPGSIVIIRDQDGNEIGRGEANDDGDFSVELNEPLTKGDHGLEVVAQDDAGNESAPSPVTVTAPDVTAPDAPISTTPEFLADGTGPFTGSAEPGSTVIVRDADGNELGRAEARDDGQFTIVLDEPLDDGAHDLELVAQDEAGNVSSPTPVTVDVDDDAPNAPIVTGPTDLADGKGPITGTAEPGSTVIVRDEDGNQIGRGEANDDGDFSIELDDPLDDGEHHLELIAQDDAGNISTPTPVTIDVDTEAPDAPVVTSPSDLSDGKGPITGTAEPGSTVIIRDEDSNELGRGEANDDGDFSIELDEPLTDGEHKLELVAADKAGNESDPTDTTVDVDTEAPTAPVVTSPSDLADGKGPISGTAEPGSTVIIRDEDGNELGRGEANDDGDFSIELDVPLDDGEHKLELVAQDDAGNTSEETKTTVDVDTEAPTAPVVTSPSDLDNGKGPISGTAEPGSIVIIRDEEGNEIGRGEANDDGDFSIELDEPLDDGEHKLELVAQDDAGNTSEETKTTVDVDTEAPTAPVVTSPSDLDNGKGPISGTAEPGSIVIIRDEEGNEIGRGKANDDGDFSIELDEPLDDGEHKLELVAEDKAGNESGPTDTTVDVDTEAPIAPVVTSPSDLADGKGPITGTAEPGSTVIVRDEDGNEIGRGEANDDGDFSIELDEPLNDGEHKLELVAADKAGNTSNPTDTTVDVDTEAPTAPVVTSPKDLDNGNGPISGTAEPGSTVIIRDEDGNEIGRGEANDDGDFSIELDEPLDDGEHKLELIAQDDAGNTSEETKTTVDVDTKAPTAPVVTSPSDLADGKGPITGTAEPGSTVIIRDEDGNELGRGEANDDGDFSIKLDEPLNDGEHKLELIAQDKAGNTSEETKTTVDVDTEAPTAPVVTSPSDLDNGKGPITGTAEPGSTVIIRDEDGNELGRGEANDDGDFSIELDEPLDDGEHKLELIAEDKAGNTSEETKATVDVDTEAPTAPVVTSPSDLSDGKGPITGTAEPGSTVIIRDEDGNELGRGEANDDGDFSIELDEPLDDGEHKLELVAQDKAGNTSEETKTTVDVDTEAPTAPVVTSPSDLTDGKGPITGTAEPGATVIIRDEDGNEIGRGDANDDGDFSIVLDEPLTDGDHKLELVAQDKAGNASEETKTTVDVDTKAPTAPVVTSPSDLADGKGPITGTAEPGSTAIIRDEDGNELGRGEANDDGDFSIELDEPLDDGEHKLELIAQDKAGNESDPTDTTVDVDTEAPTAPVVTSPSDLDNGKGPISGTADPGSIVIIRDEDGNEIGRGEANDDGDFAIELDEPLDDGEHQLELIAQDDAGNESNPTDTTVDVDTEAPTAPVVTSPSDLADGKGPITGTAEPGSTVIIRDEDGNELGRDTADENGDFEIVLDEPLTDGAHDLELIAQDKVGNESDPTKTTVDVDTEAPAAPVLEAFDDIVDGTGIVRGSAEPGSTVVIRDTDGREIGRGTADSDGRFAFRTTVPLEPGAHLLSVVAVDRFGHVSPGSSMLVTLVPESEGDDDGDAENDHGAGTGIAFPVIVTPGTGTQLGTTDDRTAPAPETDGASTTGTATTNRELAFTGVELGGWLAAALTALGLGAVLRLLARRRQGDVRGD
ncbi:Ig-like domain-containing protein [Curtobacterium flaccumfaciens]|uniref:Ig-like domain-containing protein n=5 Tax=Curtobacterium flaccumfaciens TaxID=2035 RepID=UPI0022027DC5|nr:Ig-like domain-containing protein [Curtobacterium flaccumfaciens]MCS0471982.1 Ig-like domain-containing protein [Curtobacterium flaccumfaciens pv. betae]MCS0478395.1 Ig-like domain-containing protein [Curtobacterium flaccumfaciens pv. betae]UWD85538.1 Ig-like domain-containing protein [Curtobacterium flaccumfaciens pv. betae]UWT75152.1 Ig-like domain-containing protein [Curtobacterium flaccumfaciens pv. betae]